MDEIYTIFNGYFFLTLSGIIVGALHFTVRYCCMSNCKKVMCCEYTVFEREMGGQPLISRDNSGSLAV